MVLVAFCILAVARPAAAALVTIALLGFGTILSHMAGVPPLRVTEALVVACIAGCCIRALLFDAALRRALTGRMSMPVVLFALTAVASTVVWLRVHQFETRYAFAYIEAMLRFVSRDYFLQRGEFSDLVSTALILEGLGLFVVVAAISRVDGTFFDRALRMLALGGAGVAMLSVVRLAEIVLRNPAAIDALRATSAGLRISPQIPDYIAAGSYFAVCWLVALGLAMASGTRRLIWVTAGVPLIAAIYLTGSRSVIAAALAGLLVLLLLLVRNRAAAGRSVVVFAGLAVVGMILSYSWLTGRDVAGEMARGSLTVRVELIRTGLRVIATRPLFGVGIDRFHMSAGSLSSPELHALWNARMNPHNDFVRVGAELGAIGLGLFLWILLTAGREVGQGLLQARDARLAALSAGLVAFVITSAVSDPLMVREASYAFWIALGLAVGHSGHVRSAIDPGGATLVESSGRSRATNGWRWAVGIALAALLVGSIPARARQEIAGVDVTNLTYGLFEWGTGPDGIRSRWSGPTATFFAPRRARLVEIPLSGTLPSGVPQQVEVRVDGQLANRVAVGPDWQRVRAFLPDTAATGPRRIDLQVSPTWVPAETIPGNADTRVLGVKVGEINVVMTPGQDR
jgi:hypothetical protein